MLTKYIYFVLCYLTLLLGCQNNNETIAHKEFIELEHQWSSVHDHTENITKQWIDRYWKFRNKYIGTSASTQATIKAFELSKQNLDFKGIRIKYKQLSLNDDALVELIDFSQIVSPVDDKTFEWRKIINNSNNVRVRIAAIISMAKYKFRLNDYEQCKYLLDTLSNTFYINENDLKYGKEILYMKKTMSKLSIDRVLPSFQCLDNYGDIINLSNLKGKVVLLYFYGSGCSSCDKILPILNKLYSKYNKDKFYILGISGDKRVGFEKAFSKFLRNHCINWPQTLDYRLFYQYNIKALSTILLLDKNGRTVFIGRSNEIISTSNFLQGKTLEESVNILLHKE